MAFSQILPPYVDILKLFPYLRYVDKIPVVDQWPADEKQILAKAQKIANNEAAREIAIAAPILVEALKDENPYVRHNAALSLGACGPLAKDYVDALIIALSDSEEEVRMRAATALGQIGPDAKAAIPHLLEFVKRYDKYEVRTNVEDALNRIQVKNKPN